MTKQGDFIEANIFRELIKIGHSESKSRMVAKSMALKFERQGDFPKGKVFDTLMKEAKKAVGKPQKVK